MDAATDGQDWVNPFSFRIIPHASSLSLSPTPVDPTSSVESAAIPFKLPSSRKRPGAPSPSPPPSRRQKTEPPLSPPLTPSSTEEEGEENNEQEELQTRAEVSSAGGSATSESQEEEDSVNRNDSDSAAGTGAVADLLKNGLNIVVLGMAPGKASKSAGHWFAASNNKFWKAYAEAGLTDRVLTSREGTVLRDEFNIGITALFPGDFVDRTSKEAKAWRNARAPECIPLLLRKLIFYRPRIVVTNGFNVRDELTKFFKSKSARSSLGRYRAPSIKSGLQPFSILLPPRNTSGSNTNDSERIFFWSSPGTSGANGGTQLPEHVEILEDLKRDLASVRNGTIRLPRNAVEYRAEDILRLASTGKDTPAVEVKMESSSVAIAKADKTTESEQVSEEEGGDESVTSDDEGEEDIEELSVVLENHRLKMEIERLKKENRSLKRKNRSSR